LGLGVAEELRIEVVHIVVAELGVVEELRIEVVHIVVAELGVVEVEAPAFLTRVQKDKVVGYQGLSLRNDLGLDNSQSESSLALQQFPLVAFRSLRK